MNRGNVPALGPSCDASPHSRCKDREEHSVLRPALEWLQELLSIEIPVTPHLFADCWLLGRMADVLRAAWAGKVPAHHPRPLAQMPRRRADVINDFVRWQAICTELGVSRDQLPPLADVEQGRGVAAICCCIWAAADKAAAMRLPVPRFGSADARSSLRCSMTREAGAKRAEHFLSAGDSPPKLPSLPLLTPRAFLGRAASPAAAGPIASLRDSTGSLKGWLREDSSLKTDWRQLDQQGGNRAGLRPATTAKEGPAAEAVSRDISPATSGADVGTAAGIVAGTATSSTATDASQQRWSRPMLPRLDVKAAAAAAAAEAAEQEEEEEAAAAEAAAAAAAVHSPLSSPGSSTEVSPMAPYSGSSVVTSTCTASSLDRSPDCHRLTPNTLRSAAQGNPLWTTSPGSLAPSPAAAGTQILLRQPRFEEADVAAGVSNTTVSPPPPPQHRQLLRWEDEEEGGADAGAGYGGGLLESILSPPHLKPAHSQLLGALMHTSGDSASRAAATAAAAAQARQRAQQLELGWRVVCDESEASAADGGAAGDDHGAVLQLEHCKEEDTAQQPVAAVLQQAGNEQPAVQPGFDVPCQLEAALAEAAHTEPSGNSSGGLRRAALLLLGAVAGAAAAVAAGAVQQGRPVKRSVCRPQPVPPLAGARLLPSEQQRALREARLGPSSGGATALPGDHMDAITRG